MKHFVLWVALLVSTVNSQFSLLPFDQPKIDQPVLLWEGGSFKWPCAATKALYKSSGKYNSKHVIATRAQASGDDIFLVLPRYKGGVPATFVKTSISKSGCYATLNPFPCWSMQEEGNCQALQSVVDVFLDDNGVIWTLDTGIVNTLESPVRKCPPKIVALSAKSGKVLKIINLEPLASKTSRLQYIVADYSAKKDRCFVYVSDAKVGSIIVYDVRASKGFRVLLPKAVAKGCEARDVLYLALVKKPCGYSHLIFTYLGSKRVFSIKADYLRKGYTQGRITDLGLKPNKIVIIGTDNGPNVFFRNEGYSEVYRWDSTTPFTAENFKMVYRSQHCQLATHALTDYKRNRMLVMESNFPDYMQDTVGCGAIQQLSVMQGCGS